jgi:predicted glycoside hydrolase/deacetylase ChbG (UPF0249 family)
MAARLILNADDFGLTPGVNRAIAELHAAGALTSATLMANGPAFEDAAAIARANPTLGVGCHIVLTDGTPLSHPDTIPTLLGGDGKTFRTSLADFLFAVLFRQVDPEDVIREATAQVQRLQRAGIDVTHLDTHKHTHILPEISRSLLYVAERCGVTAIRNPFEEPWSLAIGHTDPLRRMQVRLLHPLRKRFEALPQIRKQEILTTNGTLGISATGHLDEPTLRALVAHMPDGLWELVCHPGYNDPDLNNVRTRLRASREIERRALLSVFAPTNSTVIEDSPQPSAPELIHYGKLGRPGVLRELGQFIPNTGHERLL